VTTATLPEVTSAISHSDRGRDSRREEMCNFGSIVFIFYKSLNSAFRDRKCLQGAELFLKIATAKAMAALSVFFSRIW